MLRKLFDHVVEETDARCNVVAPCAVEIDVHKNIGFRSVTLDTACTHGSRARAVTGEAQEIAHIGRVKARLKRLTHDAPRST